MPRPRTIELVRAGTPEAALVDALAAELGARTGMEVVRGEPLPLEDGWKTAEGRLDSRALIHALMARSGTRPRRWHLAIVEDELCGGAVGRVFGEAAMDGCCAVVAVAPLRVGSGADAGVLRQRLLTGALHELGHLAGAEHCRRASCVMYPSLDIADTDRKGTAFCKDCAAAVQWPEHRKT